MIRRQRVALLLVGLVAAVPVAAEAQGPPSARKLRVAVMDLSGAVLKLQATQQPIAPAPQYQPYPPGQGQQTTVTIAIPPPAEFARGLTEMLTSVLVRTNRFVVLERAALAQIDHEQNLGSTGRTTRETAAQAGMLLGAEALIIGEITAFTFGKSSVGGEVANLVPGLRMAMERVSAEVTLDLRLIDAASGEILASAPGKGKASQTGVAADLVRAEKSYSADAELTTPLGLASRQAIRNAVAALLVGMPAIRWSARVVDVREGVVYLNAAAADGLRPGLELDVLAPGEVLIDPATGKSLGAPELPVGTLVVERVLEQFSTARMVAGEGVSRGHVVRMRGRDRP